MSDRLAWKTSLVGGYHNCHIPLVSKRGAETGTGQPTHSPESLHTDSDDDPARLTKRQQPPPDIP